MTTLTLQSKKGFLILSLSTGLLNLLRLVTKTDDKINQIENNQWMAASHGIAILGMFSILIILPLTENLRDNQRQKKTLALPRRFLLVVLVLSITSGIVANLLLNDAFKNRNALSVYFGVFVFLSSISAVLKAYLLSQNKLTQVGLTFIAPTTLLFVYPYFFGGVTSLNEEIFRVCVSELFAVLIGIYLVRFTKIGVELKWNSLELHFVHFINAFSTGLLLVLLLFPLRLDTGGMQTFLSSTGGFLTPIYVAVIVTVSAIPSIIDLGNRNLEKLVLSRQSVLFSFAIVLTLFFPMAGIMPLFVNSEFFSYPLFFVLFTGSTLVGILFPWLILAFTNSRSINLRLWLGSCVALFMQFAFGDTPKGYAISLLSSVLFLLAIELRFHYLLLEPILHSQERELIGSASTVRLVSIVIPSYNSGPVIFRTIEQIKEAFKSQSIALEIIVVSDGSTDQASKDLCRETTEYRHVLLPLNQGKGAAVSFGMRMSSGDVVGFIDADGDINPQCLPRMVETLVKQELDIVYGSKSHPNSMVAISQYRKLFSYSHRLMVKLLFRMDINDSQCGVKVYRRSLLDVVLKKNFERGFVFDLELFILARQYGFGRYQDFPVELKREGASTIDSSAVLDMIIGTLRIFVRTTLTLSSWTSSNVR